MLPRVSIRTYATGSNLVSVASKEALGNLSTLSVVINNAGSKVGKSGVAHLFSKFNFLNTETKSALRFTRESELLGALYSSNVTRDSIILRTQFLSTELPYFVESLGNVLTKAAFRPHQLPELVKPAALAESSAAYANNSFAALEALHEISFRKGLGNPLFYDGTTSVSIDEIKEFAAKVYNSDNVKIVGTGVNEEDLKKFVDESSFSELPSAVAPVFPVELFKGKEARFRRAGLNIALIGIPVKPADFGKYEVLSTAVGSSLFENVHTPLASVPGASSQLLKYNDAGLFVVSVSSADAVAAAQNIKEAKKIINSVSAQDLSNAVKLTETSLALQSTPEFPQTFKPDPSDAKVSSLGDFNYVAVGNTDVLPYANEL